MDSQFDQLAEAYERSMHTMPFRRHVELPSVLSAVGDVSELRILDMGCGSGLYTRLLAERGARQVTGIDQSAGMIDYAKRRENVERLGVRYLVQDASGELDPALSAAHDLVLAVYALPYAPTAKAFRQMCRTARIALTDGGRFVAATVNPELATEPGYYRPYGFDLVMPRNPHDGDPLCLRSVVEGEEFEITPYYWSRDTQQAALTSAGFADIIWCLPRCADGVDSEPFTSYLAAPHTAIVVAR